MDAEKVGKGFWAFLAKLFNKDLSELIGRVPQVKTLLDAVDDLDIDTALVITLDKKDVNDYAIVIGATERQALENEAFRLIGEFSVPLKKKEE